MRSIPVSYDKPFFRFLKKNLQRVNRWITETIGSDWSPQLIADFDECERTAMIHFCIFTVALTGIQMHKLLLPSKTRRMANVNAGSNINSLFTNRFHSLQFCSVLSSFITEIQEKPFNGDKREILISSASELGRSIGRFSRSWCTI